MYMGCSSCQHALGDGCPATTAAPPSSPPASTGPSWGLTVALLALVFVVAKR